MLVTPIILSLWMGMFFTTLPVFEKQQNSFTLQKHKEHPDPKDHTKFEDWILSQHPSPAKKALLASTLNSTYYPFTPTITWCKAHMNSFDFELLLNATYQAPSVTINSQRGNYDYKPNGAFWVDFANAQHFGGGFRSRGNVQEERLFIEFPMLAHLAYVLRSDDSILPVAKNGSPEPFLVVACLRKFDINKVPYGKDLDDCSPQQVKKDVVRLEKPFPSAHIIGLAAKDYSNKHDPRYTMKDLKYHLQAAFLGDLAALTLNGSSHLVIHSGRWGAGAFKNSLKMITALQILAAEMAFSGTNTNPRLILHSIDSSLITSLREEIVKSLRNGNSPSVLLRTFLDRQTHDSSWRPQS